MKTLHVSGSGVRSGPANASTPDRPQNVSKSDAQLFGDLAPVVRQLGIAADAAETAYREACEVDRHQTPTLCSGDEEAAVGERAPRPHDHAYTAYVAARDAHRAVAAAALTEQEARRAVMGSSDPVLELNRENLLAAWMAHPMRERGLTVYVASHLRGRIEELVADELGDPEGEYRIGWSEDSRLSDWDLRTML